MIQLQKPMRNPAPNAEQQVAIETLDCDLLVAAGAGSGKTWVLTERYMEMLVHGARPSQIVAITFTELAASEMRRRVRTALQKWLEATEDPLQQAHLQVLKEELDGAAISTIHGFCSRLLRDHPLESGIAPTVRVAEQWESDAWLIEAVEEALSKRLQGHGADDQGVEAVETDALVLLYKAWGRKQALIQAAVKAYRDILTHDYQWEDIVADTKASMAAIRRQIPHLMDRMQATVEAVVAPEYSRLTAATKPAAYVVAMGIWLEAWQRFYPVLSSWDGTVSQVSDQALSALNKLWRKSGTDSLKAAHEMIKSTLVELGDLQLTPDTMERVHAFVSLLQDVDVHYQQTKRQQQAIDFSDLERMTARMLHNHPAIAAKLQQTLRFLMIDEFQDTNRLQKGILTAIAGTGDSVRLFMVGDGKQSIYKFRGADVDVFLSVEQEQRQKARGHVEMSVNFRTQKGVIDYINDFFALKMKTPENSKAIEQVSFAPLRPARDFTTDRANVEIFAHLPVDGVSARRSEAAAIAKRIKHLVEVERPPIVYGKGPAGETARPAVYGDIAILFSATTKLALYEYALQEHGIPYSVEKGRQFYRKQEITDVLILMQVLLDPGNEIHLAAWLRSPFVGLSDETLFQLARHVRLSQVWRPFADEEEAVQSIVDALHGTEATGGDWEKALRARRQLQRWRRLASLLPLTEFLRDVLGETGYFPMVLGQFGGEQKYANVHKLLELAEHHERRQGSGLAEFVRFLEHMQDEELSETEAQLASPTTGGGAVRLMTVHASKGLEFPVVVLPDLMRQLRRSASHTATVKPGRGLGLKGKVIGVLGSAGDGLFRQLLQEESIRDELEEQRKLYVAMTRARDYLLLVATRPEKNDQSWQRWIIEHMGKVKWEELEEGVHLCDNSGARVWVNKTVYDLPVSRVDGQANRGMVPFGGQTSNPAPASMAAGVPSAQSLSASAVMMYRTCARRFWYAYRVRIPQLEEQVSVIPDSRPDVKDISGMQKGTWVHQVCERLRPGDDLAGVVADVLRQDRSLDARTEQHIAKELIRLITPYAESPFLRSDSVREQEFHLRMEAGLFQGFIDLLLFEEDGSITVVDFKTNRIRQSSDLQELTTYYTPQAHLYKTAAEALYQRPVNRVLLFFLDVGKVVEVPIDSLTMSQARDEVQATIKEIAAGQVEGDFPQTNTVEHCIRCGYRVLCDRD